MTPLIIILILLALITFIIIGKYNSIIKLKNNRENAFADIDVQLQQRFDLVPNLVNTVKGYTDYEKGTLESLTNARTAFLNAQSIDDKIGAEQQLAGALKTVFAISENYPDLKANTTFLQLQTELSDIENKLAAARRFFNSATNEYNAYIQMFPNNILAGMFNFTVATMFTITNEKAKEVVEVKF